MAVSGQNWITRLEEDSSSDENESDNIDSFYNLLSAVKQYNLNRIKKILQKVSNITNLVTKQDKNQKNNTFLHIALKNIKEDTDHEKVIEVIKCLIENGALVDAENDKKETPLDLLKKCSIKVRNFNWDPIKNILQLEKINSNRNNDRYLVENLVQRQANQTSESITGESTMPIYFKTTQGAKRTLHGYTYQLKLIMLFVQRIPDGQSFFVATEMDEAHKFDDVVLKYQEDGIWKYRFVQAKHKHEEDYEIKINDLFNIDGKQHSESPYFINNYYDSFCKIAKEHFFDDGIKEEFLLCTNIDFSKCAKSYFELTQDCDDLLLHPSLKYKLNNEKVAELRKLLQINNTNEELFSEFIQKFRFLVKFGDNVIYALINETLREHLKIKNIDFATTYIQDGLLKWFESYKNNQSKFLKIDDKNKFLKLLHQTVRSLFVAGYSSFYVKELNSYGYVFENPPPELKRVLLDAIGLSVLVTLSPKISTIKLSQMINKRLKLKQDEVIFLPSSKLTTHKELIDTFNHDLVYQLLVIECDRGDQIDKTILNDIFKAAQMKKIVIVGQKDDVENLSEKRFYDTGSSFETLNEVSQSRLLTRQVNFQGKKVGLDQLINKCSAEEIIDDLILEELMDNNIKIGNDLELPNVREDYYISRTLCKKYIEPTIFQDEEILKKYSFFISGATKRTMEQFHVNPKGITECKENTSTFGKGIVLLPEKTMNDAAFLKLHQHRENVYWIEYMNGKFFFKGIPQSRLLPGASLQEDDLSKIGILDDKILIIADEPGFGKTSFIRRVAYNLKTIMPEIWVLQIDLASCTSNKRKSLKDIYFQENDVLSAIQFITDVCIFSNDEKHGKTISKKILLKSLQSNDKENKKYPKIIILFDGFDEISPDFKDNTLILLKALKRSNITQMWITTRTCEELSLEIALGSSALHFNPINKMEKEIFAMDFWKYHLKEEEQEVPEYMLEMSTKRLFRDFDNGKLFDFTDNPLHLSMLAEVIFKKIILTQAFGTWNIVKLPYLYEEFLNIKLKKIYGNDKQPDQSVPDRERFEYTLAPLIQYLQKISFEILFSHTVQIDEANSMVKVAKRAGLLVFYSDYPKFIHRSFAEYFVCDYFVEHFNSENIPYLIVQVLTDNSYQLVRIFLNNNESFLEKFSSKSISILTALSQTKVNSHLYKMAQEQNYNLLSSCIQNIQQSDLLSKFLLFNSNDKRETIMHCICREVYDEEIFKTLLNSIQNNVSDSILMQLLFKRNGDKKIAFHLIVRAFSDLCIKKFKILLDVVRIRCQPETLYKLYRQVDDLGNTILHDACLKNVNNVVIDILESVKDKPKILKSLLIKTNQKGQNVLHCLVMGFRYVGTNFFGPQNFIKETLGPDLFGDMILQVDNERNTVLHLACIRRDQIFIKYLLEAVKDIPNVLQRLLLQTNKEEQSIFHCIFPKSPHNYLDDISINCLKEIIDFIKLNLNSTILHTLLLQSDKNGNTLLNMACISAFNECVSYLLKIVEGYPTTYKSLLLKLNKQRQNIFHSIFFNVHKNQLNMILVLKEILNFITVQFSSEILYDLLSQVDYQGHTALHFAFILRSCDGVTYLLETVKSNSELLTKLILKTNRKGQNIIHCIFRRDHHYQTVYDGRSVILNMVLDMATSYVNIDLLYRLLLQEDKDGNTSLHSACAALSVRCVHSLIEIVRDNSNILKKYLIKTNSKGQNILHCIFMSKFSIEELDSKNIIMCFLIELIKSNFNFEVLEDLLLQPDNNGNTILHDACFTRSSSCIVPLLEVANYNSDVPKELLLKTNRKGRNALHCILFRHKLFDSSDYTEIKFTLYVVIDFIKNYFNSELLHKLLLQADYDGNTALHSACMIRANTVISDLLEQVRGNPEILRELWLKTNLQGQTALHYIFVLKDSYSFTQVAMTLQEILGFLSHYDSQMLYSLLLQTDHQGRTALHFACALRSNQGVSYLIEAMRGNSKVLDEFILKTNCYGRNALHSTITIHDVDVLYIDKEIYKVDATQNLLYLVRQYCDYEVLKKLILQTDIKKCTSLHMACQHISDETEIYNQKMFLKKNSNIEASYNSKTFDSPYISRLQIILDFIKVVCPEILSEILCQVVNMRTILHVICNGIYMKNDGYDENEWEDDNDEEVDAECEEALAQEINLDLLSSVLETIKNDTELVNKLILITDNHCQTALHYTVYKFDNPFMFKVLFDFVKLNCKAEVLRELLYKSDDDGCTILHLACKKNKEILTCVVYALEDINEPLGDFLVLKDNWERNALDYALDNFAGENISLQVFLNWWNKHTHVENIS